MRCHSHRERAAVGACVGCGRGLCVSCATLTDDSRLVCSRGCANRLQFGKRFLAGCVLLGLGALLVAQSAYLFTARSPFVAAIVVLCALGFLIVGAAAVTRETLPDSPFEPLVDVREEIRSRAGVALRAAHKHRAAFVGFLALYTRSSGRNLTLAQLEWLDDEARRRRIEEVCSNLGDLPDWITCDAPGLAATLAEQVELAHTLGWTFFAEHDARNRSYAACEAMRIFLIDAAEKLERGCVVLWTLGDHFHSDGAERDGSHG
jgi:hypothetical protein